MNSNSIADDKIQSLTYPLMNGDCSEYPDIAEGVIDVSADVKLYYFQDMDYVWICYAFPAGSWGVLDLFIDAPGLSEPMNLHVSAQLGEWPATEEAPAKANSNLWWEIEGWFANVVSLNGMRTSGERRVINFKPATARELQISKDRFGHGDWELKFTINEILTETGTETVFYPPKDGDKWTSWKLPVK